MTVKPAPLDISDKPQLAALVRELLADGRPRELRRCDEVLGVLSPVAHRARRRRRESTAEEIAAFESAAGGWAGNVDVDRFQRDNETSRRISTRPPVEL